ncbi:MAG TPA: response regulator transcription factor [Candidatus Saccharimonadales bacterium]|nr:response regulator transcription factor [Candidatus Saccharimonadales bacterium]
MKILIIEDSRLLASSVKSLLSKQYTVDVVHTGREGVELASTNDYAVVILDLSLPDINGEDVCKQLRASQVNTPILVLSGARDTFSRVKLLESGADDYVTKPFDSQELRARILALIRRTSRSLQAAEIRVDDLVVDTTRRIVRRAGSPIPLRRKEFDILQYLVQNQGHAITREMIFSHVWESGKEGWNNTIDVHIKHLRDKVDRPFGKKLIKTAYGVGYMVDETG